MGGFIRRIKVAHYQNLLVVENRHFTHSLCFPFSTNFALLNSNADLLGSTLRGDEKKAPLWHLVS
jgi:hypothetical protein